jgi:hypothetical protein
MCALLAGHQYLPQMRIQAIYQTADAERRAFILLEILSKPVSMHIDAGRLRKAG